MSVTDAKWVYFPKIKVITTKNNQIYVSKDEFTKHLEANDELLNLYGGTISVLYVCSNTFSISFEQLNEAIPLSEILNLVCSIPKSSSSYIYPTVWLEFSNNRHGINFKIPVCEYEGNFLLNYDFHFQSPFSTKMALQLFTQTLDIENDNAFFANSKSELYESDYSNFLKEIINDKLFIVVKLTKKKVKNIKERINTIKEVLESEVSYNLRLLKLKDICNFFDEHAILDNENQMLFQSLIDSLYAMSNDIKIKLSSYTSYYMVPLGQIFLKYTSLIPVYVRYADLLQEAMAKFRKNMENPLFKNIVDKYQSEPYFDMLSLEQYLHEPDQRLPRYRMLIQRAFDSTPWGHPDKVLLMSVIEKFNNERIKNNGECLFEQSTLDKYPSELNEYLYYLPLENGQGYICNYKVLFNNEQSIAVLYSDYMRILNISTVSTKVIDYPNLRFLNSDEEIIENPSFECVIFVFSCHHTLKFNSKFELKSFIQNVKEASFMTQLKNAKFSVGLYWDQKVAACPIHLQHHTMSELNGNIYVFGGIDEKGLFSSSFISYSIENNEWKQLTASIQPRKDTVMISVKDKIYLFGGYSDNMEPLNDLWIFDGVNWSLAENNVSLADGGYYSATKYTNNRILFVGGDKKIQTLIYNINECQWSEICSNEEAIIPMKYHNVAFCQQSETVLLFGGMSIPENEPVKDLYILDEEKNSWIKNSISLIGQFPTPRYGNLMLSLKSYIFILGGIGSSAPYVLNPNRYFNLIRNEGKFPMFVSFSAACVANDAIWALGGATEDGISNVFYKITILRDYQQQQ